MKQISIIGLSRAGKTCYMYAMAKTMKRGVNGINIFVPDAGMRDQLELGWRKIRREHKWPAGNDKVTHWNFQCMLNLRDVMDFCWDDFKGGTLSSFGEVVEKDRREFYRYLQNSDGMIFFIAADMVKRILMDDPDAEDDMDDLDMLNSIIMENGEKMKQIPITVAITKSDLLDDEAKELLFPVIKQIFPSLFVIGNNVKTLIVPVSIGHDFDNGEQDQDFSGLIYADPKEGNIHLPIMFNLYHYLKEYITETREELTKLKKRLSDNSTDITIAEKHGPLWRWWNGYDMDDLQSSKENLLERIKKTEQELSQFEMDLAKTREEFTKDCQYYVNGKLQTL